MNIFDYFFNCFKYIINILDVDFLGLGFSYLDFMLGASIAFMLLNFVLRGFNEQDRFNFLSITGGINDLNNASRISNSKREKQITTMHITHDLDSNIVTSVESNKIYKNGELKSVVNYKSKS